MFKLQDEEDKTIEVFFASGNSRTGSAAFVLLATHIREKWSAEENMCQIRQYMNNLYDCSPAAIANRAELDAAHDEY